MRMTFEFEFPNDSSLEDAFSVFKEEADKAFDKIQEKKMKKALNEELVFPNLSKEEMDKLSSGLNG